MASTAENCWFSNWVRKSKPREGLAIPDDQASACLQIEQKCSTIENVNGREFLRKVKSLSRRSELSYRWNPERGSGSHGTLYLGTQFTVVKDLRKEISAGLLSAMCKQIGIRKEAL